MTLTTNGLTADN